MGIIKKQGIQNAIVSYVGAVLGFINVGLLMPNILETSQVGMINLLIAISAILIQFGTLGFATSIVRDFPYYRDKSKNHHGFLSLVLIVVIVGFVVSSFVFVFGKPYILKHDYKNIGLINDLYFLIFPLTGFGILYMLLDYYNTVLYNSVIGQILKEVVLRIIFISLIILYHFSIINFKTYVIVYSYSIVVPCLFIAFYLIKNGQFKITKIRIPIFSLKSMSILAFYTQIISLLLIMIANIDKVLINKFTNLEQTGIYSIAFFFGSIIMLPSRAISKISVVVLGDFFKNRDYNGVSDLYKKTCILGLLTGAFTLLILITNIELIFNFIPSEYKSGWVVIILIGLSNLIEISTGMSGSIMVYSNNHKSLSLITLIYFIAFVTLSFYLIPLYGIIGAAISILISTFIYNLIRHIYIWKVLKMQPFDKKSFLAVSIFIFASIISYILPNHYFCSVYWGSIINSMIISFIFLTAIEYFNVYKDFSILQIIVRKTKSVKK